MYIATQAAKLCQTAVWPSGWRICLCFLKTSSACELLDLRRVADRLRRQAGPYINDVQFPSLRRYVQNHQSDQLPTDSRYEFR
jgi:hypothetical protein